MAAVYPGSIRSFTTKANNVDVIDASHPNLIQEEVVAIQSTLGTNPATSSTGSGVYVSTSTAFATVKARLDNIENGVLGDVHTQYAKNVGGSTITPSAAATKGLVIRAASGQTANLQEWQNSSGTVVSYIDSDGVLNADSSARDNLTVITWLFG